MKIELKDVGVRYGNETALQHVSFTIEPGDRVALIGPTGSGKSTIAKLVGLLRDPDEGEVLFDGKPGTYWRKEDVLRYIGHILQRPELISGTVRENVCLSTHTADLSHLTDEKIWRVLDTVSSELRGVFGPEGLDRNVGKQGQTLSGGEMQRVCIARALAKDPHLLIVDEATSALDAVTQAAVQAGIESIMHVNAAVLIIAHRLSTLTRCNKFVYLRKLSDCRVGQSQVAAVTTSMGDLAETVPEFRHLAQSEGVRL